MVGTGIFTLPYAFVQVGPYVGIVLALITFIICYHSVQILIKSIHVICVRSQRASMNFSEIIEAAFLYGGNYENYQSNFDLFFNLIICFCVGPKPLAKFSKLSRHLTTFLIGLSYIGTCSLYLVTVAGFMQQVYGLNEENELLSMRFCITIVFIPSFFICLVPHLKYLAPFSTLSNIINFFAIFATFYYFFEGSSTLAVHPYEVTFANIFDFFGVAVFAMNCVGILVSLENQTRNPQDFFGCSGILNVGMSIVLVTYLFMGLVGSLRFGPATKDSIILNLPENSNFSISVKIMLMSAIILAIGLNFFVAFEAFWKVIEPKVARNKKRFLAWITRIVMIFAFYLLAVLVPTIGAFVSLIGAIAYSLIDLVYPALIQFLILYNEPGGFGEFRWIMWKDLILISFGICIFVFGTLSSIKNIYETVYQ